VKLMPASRAGARRALWVATTLTSDLPGARMLAIAASLRPAS
jgi:hypothetical protein